MVDTIETRIKLPGDVHRLVKAQAVLHDTNLAEALGMCVAFICSLTAPLSWLDSLQDCLEDIADNIELDRLPF